MVMALLMLTALLCSCGSAVKNEGLTVDDFADSSENQQGWIGLLDSNLVVNPAEYQGNDSGNGNRMALNLGLLDESKNVMTALDDVIFLMENNAANGLGGETIFTIEGLGDIKEALRYTSKATVSYEDGSFTATQTGSSSQNLGLANKITGLTFDKDIVAILNVANYTAGTTYIIDDEETEPGWGFSANIQVVAADNTRETIAITAQASNEETGRFVAYFSDVVNNQTTKDLATSTGNINNAVITIYGQDTYVTVDEYRIVLIDKGFKYSDAEAKTTWYPYAIVSELEYPNGTKAEVTDYFAHYTTIGRKIHFLSEGLFTLGGKVEGTLTYDESNNVMVIDGDGYTYAISPKKKQNVKFYNSEADMLADKNATTEPTSSTKYWTVSLGRIDVDTELFVAASAVADSEGVSVDELIARTKEATESGKTQKRLDYTKEWWESYIHVFDLPDALILNVPAGK